MKSISQKAAPAPASDELLLARLGTLAAAVSQQCSCAHIDVYMAGGSMPAGSRKVLVRFLAEFLHTLHDTVQLEAFGVTEEMLEEACRNLKK